MHTRVRSSSSPRKEDRKYSAIYITTPNQSANPFTEELRKDCIEKFREETNMMNVIAIGLVIASMAFAGVWSPNPQGEEQVITKGGHRAVVVEYADDYTGGHVNTKVSISPPLTGAHDKASLLSTADEQLSSAAASVAGVAQDAKRGTGELICDAFGKCRDKVTGAIYKAKDKVTGTAQEVGEGAKETVDSVKDAAREAASKATHTAEQVTGKAKESASRAKDAAIDTAEDLKSKGKAAASKATHTAEQVTGKAKQSAARAKDAAKDTAEDLKSKGKAAVEETAEKAKKKGKETTKEISDIAQRAKEVMYDVVSYLIPASFFNSLMSLVHLLGFATAYGTATWVTFAMSHLLARSLPRQQFGVLQSRVYPVYFKAMASCLGLALLGHLFGRRRVETSSVAGKLQAYNLAGLVALVLLNLFYLEPRATKVMFERMKLEKEEGRGVSAQATKFVDQIDTPLTTTTTTTTTRREEGAEVKSKMERLSRRLKKLNSYSSLLNVMTLMGLTWHLVYLSQHLCL